MAIVKWEEEILHSESGEWVSPHIVVIENGDYWYENANGIPLDTQGLKQPAFRFRKNKQPYCEMRWVSAPIVTSNALAAPFNPDIGVRVSEQTQEDCVYRANQALQAMRAHERKIAGKLVLTEEERAESVRLVANVQETQADIMIAVRNRSWQQAGIAPGMRNPRIAHVNVASIGELPEALKEALKKRLSDRH